MVPGVPAIGKLTSVSQAHVVSPNKNRVINILCTMPHFICKPNDKKCKLNLLWFVLRDSLFILPIFRIWIIQEFHSCHFALTMINMWIYSLTNYTCITVHGWTVFDSMRQCILQNTLTSRLFTLTNIVTITFYPFEHYKLPPSLSPWIQHKIRSNLTWNYLLYYYYTLPRTKKWRRYLISVSMKLNIYLIS